MFESSGEITPPCGVPATVARHCPSSITPAASHCRSSFSTRRSEIRCATSVEQLRVIDAAEVVADVGVQHVVAAARAVHAQRFQRLRRAALRPKPIRRGPEVRLEDRLQHQRRRHLRHPVSDRRNAERPLPAIGLRDVSPQDRLRTIRACAQRGAELLEQALDAVLLDCGERLAIDARRAAVPFHPPPRLLEDVTPPDPIHQGVEAPLRGSLGRDPESALQLAHFVGGRMPTGVIGTGPAGHALARACSVNVTTAGTLPSSRVVRREARRYYDPLGLPLRTTRFRRRLIRARCPDSGRADGPLVFRSSPCTRAAPPTPPRPATRDLRTEARADMAFAVT